MNVEIHELYHRVMNLEREKCDLKLEATVYRNTATALGLWLLVLAVGELFRS